MKKAFDHGCNFYDTAIPEEYGDAEYKLGEFIRTVDRNKIVISDKARFYGGGDIYREVLRSTENLGTKPDIYFVHQVDDSKCRRGLRPRRSSGSAIRFKERRKDRIYGHRIPLLYSLVPGVA